MLEKGDTMETKQREPELKHADMMAETVRYVEAIPGENSRCLVPSRSSTIPWLVDVDSYNGTGECACQDFKCNHEPYLSGKKGAEGYSPKRRCFHIIVALEYFHLLAVESRKTAT